MKIKTVAEQWDSFALLTFGTGDRLASYSPIQIQEMRRAFYAGSCSMLHLLQSVDDDATEADVIQQMQALSAEYTDFLEQVNKGKA